MKKSTTLGALKKIELQTPSYSTRIGTKPKSKIAKWQANI